MKDKRFILTGKLLRSNEIKSLSEIVDLVPKTIVAKQIGVKPERFNRLLENVELFVVKELMGLADSLEVELGVVFDLIENELRKKKPKKK